MAAEKGAAAGDGARETQLSADVLREGTRRGNHARFDFHLLRLAVQIADQVIDVRNDRGNVANDQLVRAVIEQNIAARAEELLQRPRRRSSPGIAEDAA